MLRYSLPVCLRIVGKHCHLRQTARRLRGERKCVGEEKNACFLCISLEGTRVNLYACAPVCLAARIGVMRPVSPHPPRAELSIRRSLSAEAGKCGRAIRSTRRGKEGRSPPLSLAGSRENVTLHQAAINGLPGERGGDGAEERRPENKPVLMSRWQKKEENFSRRKSAAFAVTPLPPRGI